MSSDGLTEGISPLGHFFLRFFSHEGWRCWWHPPQMSLVFRWKPRHPLSVLRGEAWHQEPGDRVLPQISALTLFLEVPFPLWYNWTGSVASFPLSVEPGSACHCSGLYVSAVPVQGPDSWKITRGQGVRFPWSVITVASTASWFSFLINFIPKYFILLDATINGIAFVISLSDFTVSV